ncbi:MAG: peptidoglycan-binding protein [Methanomicrobiales archaeon]|nr:peptidoglycan-binding protein [Methanomicrobiales archaeon]
MFGFGADVPYVDASGQVGVDRATLDLNCEVDGDLSSTQRMLAGLGYYFGPIDGKASPFTSAAMLLFVTKNKVQRGQFCQALMSAWQRRGNMSVIQDAMQIAKQQSTQAPGTTFQQAGPLVVATPRAPVTALPPAPAPGASWWSSQSTAVKVGIGIGAAALLFIGVKALGGPKSFTPNAPRRRRRRTDAEAWKWIHSKATSTRKRMAAAVEKYGRTHPPKGYPKKRSAYAWPEGYKYPINNKQRVRNAASRFGKHKRRYPPAVRAKIAHRIDMAKRRFHIGEYR